MSKMPDKHSAVAMADKKIRGRRLSVSYEQAKLRYHRVDRERLIPRLTVHETSAVVSKNS